MWNNVKVLCKARKTENCDVAEIRTADFLLETTIKHQKMSLQLSAGVVRQTDRRLVCKVLYRIKFGVWGVIKDL